jgi:hypothetical protein
MVVSYRVVTVEDSMYLRMIISPFSGSSCRHMKSPVLVGLSDNWLRGAASQIVDDGGRTSHLEDRLLRNLAGEQWPIKKESLG